MARNKDLPQVWQHAGGGGGGGNGVRYLRDMTPTEIAEREARQKPYEAMLARQQAYEDSLVKPAQKQERPIAGRTFTKPCTLPNGVINHVSPSGAIPTDPVSQYGGFALLGGRETDAQGNIPLKKISGGLPASLGTLLLGGAAATAGGVSCGGLCSAGAVTSGATSGVAAGALAGVVALLWPSSLGDSSLYTEEQLQSLKEGRTRVRLTVEQQADGTLKGYGYNTQKRREWEMIPVVQFVAQGSQQVADFGDGVTLIWTPAADPSSTLGIPALEGAPQAPQIWIYPPTEQADNIIVSPIYPDAYKDFILVFPADSGVQPLYIVMNVRKTPGTVTGQGEDIAGIWLIGASSGVGVPIPTDVADALRGREFKSFDAFRAALWKAVSGSTAADQFVKQSVGRMRTGRAPRVRKADRVGGRLSYELHHLEKYQKAVACTTWITCESTHRETTSIFTGTNRPNMTDTLLKNSFSEYTEAEFIKLLEELAKEDEEAENDDRADLLLLHFEKVSEHPAGSDLIYYPEPGADNSPEGVTQIVKEWRASKGLPGFKDERIDCE